MTPSIEQLTETYEQLGYDRASARAEAAREIRLTTGDPYAYRTDDELREMQRVDAELYEQARRTAGVCDEFPAGEFAVPGFNCDLDYSDEEDYS